MGAENRSILEDPRFDLEDFLTRWKKARISALRSLSSDLLIAEGDEADLLVLVSEKDREPALRRVFDQSRKFGLGASRFLGLAFEISDLAEILAQSSIPCVGGKWRKHHSAYVRERQGCQAVSTLGSFGCDYWREALDGLVMGVGENERMTRHRSMGHGDADCLDILYLEEFKTPKVVSPESQTNAQVSPKYGQIPEEVLKSFEPVRSRFKQMRIDVVLSGISEGVLYYRLDPEKGVLCGAAGKIMHDIFIRDTERLYPKLRVLDTAPLAVYGGAK